MDVCYSNTYGTLKQIHLFYLNYIFIKIGISCCSFFCFCFCFCLFFFFLCLKGRNKLN